MPDKVFCAYLSVLRLSLLERGLRISHMIPLLKELVGLGADLCSSAELADWRRIFPFIIAEFFYSFIFSLLSDLFSLSSDMHRRSDKDFCAYLSVLRLSQRERGLRLSPMIPY